MVQSEKILYEFMLCYSLNTLSHTHISRDKHYIATYSISLEASENDHVSLFSRSSQQFLDVRVLRVSHCNLKNYFLLFVSVIKHHGAAF